MNYDKYYSCVTAVSWEVPKKPIKSMVLLMRTAFTTPTLHHLGKSFDMMEIKSNKYVGL